MREGRKGRVTGGEYTHSYLQLCPSCHIHTHPPTSDDLATFLEIPQHLQEGECVCPSRMSRTRTHLHPLAHACSLLLLLLLPRWRI